MLIALGVLGYCFVGFLFMLAMRVHEKVSHNAEYPGPLYGAAFLLWPVVIALAAIIIPILLIGAAGSYLLYEVSIEKLSNKIVNLIRHVRSKRSAALAKAEQAKREAKKFHDDEMRVVNDYRK